MCVKGIPSFSDGGKHVFHQDGQRVEVRCCAEATCVRQHCVAQIMSVCGSEGPGGQTEALDNSWVLLFLPVGLFLLFIVRYNL